MCEPADLPGSASGQGWRLPVRLTPRATLDRVDGVVEMPDGTAIAARVRAIPENGKANAAVIALIATWLGLAKSDVRLVAGGKSRYKTLVIHGDAGEIRNILLDRIGTDRG